MLYVPVREVVEVPVPAVPVDVPELSQKLRQK